MLFTMCPRRDRFKKCRFVSLTMACVGSTAILWFRLEKPVLRVRVRSTRPSLPKARLSAARVMFPLLPTTGSILRAALIRVRASNHCTRASAPCVAIHNRPLTLVVVLMSMSTTITMMCVGNSGAGRVIGPSVAFEEDRSGPRCRSCTSSQVFWRLTEHVLSTDTA